MQQDSNIDKVGKLILDLAEALLRNHRFEIIKNEEFGHFNINIQKQIVFNRVYNFKVNVTKHTLYDYYFSIGLLDDDKGNTIVQSLIKAYINNNNQNQLNNDTLDIKFGDFVDEPVFFMKNVITLFVLNFNHMIKRDEIEYNIKNYKYVVRDEKIRQLIK